MERWSNDIVEIETLKENMQMFLLWSKRNNRSATVSNYDNWLDDRNLVGKSPVIYKKLGSFADFRDKIANKLDYKFNLTRRYTTENIIKAPQECLKQEGNIKYAVYEKWRKEKNKPSATSIIDRLETNWTQIRKIYGNLNKDVLPKGYWDVETCTIAINNYPEIEFMSILEYKKFRKNHKLPSKNTIKTYFNSWSEMKKQIFEGITKHLFCRECVYYTNCKYNYNLNKCKWYEEG